MTAGIATHALAPEYYQSVPAELKKLQNWVGWRLETRGGKPTKIPYSSTGVMASSTNPSSWRTFEDVKGIPPSESKGAGFVFSGNGIIGIDLDHCLDDNGEVSEKFRTVVETLDTYTEVSPSGTGLHLFVKCSEKPYPIGRKKDDLEIYSEGRYFTITGLKWKDSTPNEIVEFDAETIRSVCDPFLGPLATAPATPPRSTTTSLSDYDIQNIISKSANSSKFDRLMRGSISEYGDDDSRADMALAAILAFYTTDENQIARIMYGSKLQREKWNRDDYLYDRTIRKAIDSCTEHYDPKYNDIDTRNIDAILTMLLGDPTPSETATTVGGGVATAPATQSLAKYNAQDIADIREAIRQCNYLPPLPEIKHPLFKRWVDVGSRLMYSRTPYHFGNLITIASMALGRRVCVRISTTRTYSNLYTMLVGVSTISGKSFSSNTAIREFGVSVTSIPTLLNPTDSTTLTRKSCSNPRLVQDLSLSHNMLWYYDEAKEFFDEAGERGWNAPIVGNLCTAYDGELLKVSRSNRSHRQGEEDDNSWICPTPFLSLLFNMTITQLKEASTKKIVDSGFFFRWLWFLENGGEKKENVTPTKEDLDEIAEIEAELLRLGTFLKQLPEDAISFCVHKKIEAWSMEMSRRSDDENYQSATGRSVVHAYKLAMIFTLFDPEFQKIIFGNSNYPVMYELPDVWVDEAIRIVDEYLLPRMMVVVDYSSKVDARNRQEHTLACLRALGGIAPHSVLLKRTKLDSKEFLRAIATLIESEDIIPGTDGKKNIYHLAVDRDTTATEE